MVLDKKYLNEEFEVCSDQAEDILNHAVDIQHQFKERARKYLDYQEHDMYRRICHLVAEFKEMHPLQVERVVNLLHWQCEEISKSWANIVKDQNKKKE